MRHISIDGQGVSARVLGHRVPARADVVAGKVKRAPLWMQKWGLEWFYRVLQEPDRMWRRYLVTNSQFGWLLLKAKLGLESLRLDDSGAGSAVSTMVERVRGIALLLGVARLKNRG